MLDFRSLPLKDLGQPFQGLLYGLFGHGIGVERDENFSTVPGNKIQVCQHRSAAPDGETGVDRIVQFPRVLKRYSTSYSTGS